MCVFYFILKIERRSVALILEDVLFVNCSRVYTCIKPTIIVPTMPVCLCGVFTLGGDRAAAVKSDGAGGPHQRAAR